MLSFLERHAERIAGVIGCFDRVIITGTIPGICYAQGMTDYLKFHRIRIFDFKQWAKALREEVRANAQRLAEENGLKIQHLPSSKPRKDQMIQKILEQRGRAPGLVHIFSAMEPCPSFEPWHNKQTHQTYLRHQGAKCLHYYFYFILKDLGLCYLRVPTWVPFRLQFYFNGHHALAAKLHKKNVGFQLLDNAFVQLDDYAKAQTLANQIHPQRLARRLHQVAKQCCPVIRHFPQKYYWSLMQVEYALDIVFKRQADLEPIYEELSRTAVHAIKAENIATFLGRKFHGNYQGEMGNWYQTRIEGTCIKHRMGPVGIKMYDKFNQIIRIEPTANNVSFFKHYRRVDKRDGTWEMKTANLKKSIYSLPALAELLSAAANRYLAFLSAIDDPTIATKDLDKISRPTRDANRSYRGFNFFHGGDAELFRTLMRGEFNISGFRNRDLRVHLHGKTPYQVSRFLKRLRQHGLIKKIGKAYKYYLTNLGRRVGVVALKLKEMFIIPALRGLLLEEVKIL